MIRPTSAIDAAAPIAPAEGRAGYATARDAERRARSTLYGQDAQTRLALDRLDRLLTSGVPLRRDVPPGYYLDVQA
jgi:hypothetical protein